MAPALLPAGHHASIYERRVRHRPWEQLQLGSTDSSFPFAVCLKDSSKRLRSTRSCTSPTQALPLAEVLYSCRYSALLPQDSSAPLRSSRLPPPLRACAGCALLLKAPRGGRRAAPVIEQGLRSGTAAWPAVPCEGTPPGQRQCGERTAHKEAGRHIRDHTALLTAPLVVRPL